MRTFWAQPLRRQLLLANLLLLVPVLGLAVWSAVSGLFDRREEVVSQARVVATTTASYIDRDLRYIDSMGKLLAAEPAVQALDGAGASATLQKVILGRPSIKGVLITTQGREVGRAVRPDEQVPAVPWTVDLAEAARHVLSGGSSDAGAQHLVYSYPITGADMKARGTLAVFVDMNRLVDALKALPLPVGSVVQIVDPQGRVVAQNVQNSSTAGGRLLQMDPDRTVSSSEALVVEGADKVVRLQVETRATQGPWQIMIGVPRSEAFNRAWPVMRRSVLGLAIGLLGGCLGAWFLSRRLSRSLTHLDKAARRIAAGDFSPIQQQPMHSAEFADLQATFGRMLGQFNSTRSALDAQMGEERRIRQELESLQGQVIRQERLAAVGQLVSGVAHEINNPLQAILGFAELLQMQQDVPDSVKGDLKVIQKESARACAIIRNLAMFARQQPGIAGPVLMTDVIRSVVELRHRRLQSEDIELHVQDRAIRPVKAILTELQQVVLNFVVNAEQAIIASGRLPGRITIRTLEQDERVVLEVEDTGPGIPPENEAKLFQPFFTTKPVGQGTGLGLSISYGIVESLGGGIGYRSAPAGGAIFYFDLPATIDTRGPQGTESRAPGSGSRGILPLPVPTSRIYYSDSSCLAFTSVVRRAFVHDGKPAVVLDQTAFYPTSGGQPCDTGRLGTATVVDVVDAGDEVVHVLDSPLGEETSVAGIIDAHRRLDHMQQHTGQHVLSAAFDRLFDNRTTSFHMGGDVSTIDLAAPVGDADVSAAVAEANRIVWENRPVSIRVVSETEAARLPLRKEPARTGALRLIEVEDFDLSACGGTHVSRTGTIGVIAALGHERLRGGARVTFVCGQRALRVLDAYRDAISGSVRVLSVLPHELPAAVERVQAEAKDLRRHLAHLQGKLALVEADRLVQDAEVMNGVTVVAAVLDGWDAAGIKVIAAAACRQDHVVAVIVTGTSPVAIAIARSATVTIDAGRILKALTERFGGRGGGKPDFAQGGGMVGSAPDILAAARTAITVSLSV